MQLTFVIVVPFIHIPHIALSRYALLGFLLVLLPSWALGQGNPFDLVPRLSSTEQSDTLGAMDTGNPFDIRPPETPEEAVDAPAATRSLQPELVPERSPVVTIDSRYRRVLLIGVIGMLLLVTVLVTLFRGQLSRAYRAFLNDNMLNQLQREREGGGGLPYYLFYLLFMVNAGFYLFLLSHRHGQPVAESPLMSLAIGIGAVAAFFLGKHLLLAIIGAIFPVGKEVKMYSLTIMVFNIILGLILLLANLLLAYTGEDMLEGLTYGTLGAIGAMYLFLILRALFQASRLLVFHKFHFLLYICTVEVAPVLILVKLILG